MRTLISKFPVELLLGILNAIPPEGSRPDYQTKLAFSKVNRRFALCVTPEIWSTCVFYVYLANVEPFLSAAVCSRFFGNALGQRVKVLSLQGFASSEVSEEYLRQVAVRTFQRMTNTTEVPVDFTGTSAAQDLLWMALAACPSLQHLTIDEVDAGRLISPTLSSRLPLPAAWETLQELDIRVSVKMHPTPPSSILDILGGCPALCALRRLKVMVLVAEEDIQYEKDPASPDMPDLSTVEDLEIVEHSSARLSGRQETISELMLGLLCSAQPKQLTLHTSNTPFRATLRRRTPPAVSTIILRGPSAMTNFDGWFQSTTSPTISPRNLAVNLHFRQRDTRFRPLQDPDYHSFPRELEEIHLHRDIGSQAPRAGRRNQETWANDNALSMLPFGSVAETRCELRYVRFSLGVVRSILAVKPLDCSLRAIYLHPHPIEGSAAIAAMSSLRDLCPPPPLPAAVPEEEDEEDEVKEEFKDTIFSLHEMTNKSKVDVFLPKDSLAIYALEHPLELLSGDPAVFLSDEDPA